MNLDFGGILNRAFRITRSHRILWLFGILAALAGGSSGPNFNFNFGSGGGGGDGGGGGGGAPTELPPALRRFFDRLEPETVIPILIAIAVVVLLLVVVFIIVGTIGKGGLIGGVQRADTQGSVTFGQAWAIGRQRFWPVLLIGLAVAVLGFAIAIVSVVLAATVCLLPLACVGFLVLAALSVYTNFAQVAAVVDGLGTIDALRRGWEVIRANFANVLILTIIVAVIGWLAGFVIALPLFGLLVPVLVGAAGAVGGVGELLAASALMLGACLVVYIPVAIVLNGILQTWFGAVWTLAYKQLTAGSASAPSAAVQSA